MAPILGAAVVTFVGFSNIIDCARLPRSVIREQVGDAQAPLNGNSTGVMCSNSKLRLTESSTVNQGSSDLVTPLKAQTHLVPELEGERGSVPWALGREEGPG